MQGGYKHGPNLWQEHHHKTKDALHGCSKGKRQYASIWDRWQRDETDKESQLVHEWSDAWVRYLDHIAKNRHLPKKRRTYKGIDMTIYLRVSTKISKRHHYQKDQDTKMLTCTSQYDKIAEVLLSQKLKKQRLRNQLDPSMQRNLAWLSTHWAEYFAKEQPLPASSSSWTPSSSWWISSSWTSDWHQNEWKDTAWSDKW